MAHLFLISEGIISCMLELKQYTRDLLDISLKKYQVEQLERYEETLMDWNQRMNLTAIQDPKQIRVKHFLDSFTCTYAAHDLNNASVIDIGTGAGFPGIPLKILFPKMKLTLVESIRKKVGFCQFVVNNLGLDNVEVLNERAERVGQEKRHRQKYDWAIARAVALMPILVEYLLPLTRVGGKALAMKGEKALAETHQAEYAMQILGGHLHKIIPITLPGVVEQRYLIEIDKIAATPKEYPRRVGLPGKQPLQNHS